MTGELCLCAIDPGLSGAVAFYFPAAPDRIAVDDMPVVNGEVDVAALARRIAQMGPTYAVVERVASRPTDSRPAAFAFGGAYHAARAVLLLSKVPTHLVAPQTWKRHHKLSGADDPKEASRGLALRLFPSVAERFARKSDHNRAEAALIAKFGADTING